MEKVVEKATHEIIFSLYLRSLKKEKLKLLQNMKKLFYATVAFMTTLAISTSCDIHGEETPTVYQGFGSIVEERAGAPAPYSIHFDDGKTAFVANANQWSPSFKANISELRYLINYEIAKETSVGYDMEVRILGGKECMPTQYYLPNFADANIDTEKYNHGASAAHCFVSPATDWLTLSVTYNTSAEFITKPPKLILVQNTPENSPYKNLYADDNYLYLELYHDGSEYSGTQQYQTHLGCKLPDVANILTQYSGVKVLSISHNTNRPEVFTFNFETEEDMKVE